MTSCAFGHKRAALRHVTSCYDTQLDHGRMRVSLIWPSHELPFRTHLFNIPTTTPPGEVGPCHIALANIIYHTHTHTHTHLEVTKQRLSRQFGGQAPGTILCCDTFLFHTTVFPSFFPLATTGLYSSSLSDIRAGCSHSTTLSIPPYQAHLHFHHFFNMAYSFYFVQFKSGTT